MLYRLRTCRPLGFIIPCQPAAAHKPPSGPGWIHEIKHDGYRLMVRRAGERVRCFTRNGNNWADRFPAIVDAALRIKAQSFLFPAVAAAVRLLAVRSVRSWSATKMASRCSTCCGEASA